MQKKYKVAIARILADLIKADRIIDAAEMECWRDICVRYGIGPAERIGARALSFADAIQLICDDTIKGIRKDILGDCRAMTVSDGCCAASEAMLMIALACVLDDTLPFKGEIISLPRTNLNIESGTVLYIESALDEEINRAIERDYRTLYKELQFVGFHFIYIPKIIDHYRHTDRRLFLDILSFLAPGMSEAGLATTYDALMNMTTSRFCNDLLCNKCGLTALRNVAPSLFIKIGNSYVGEDQYANYLKFSVGVDILDAVREFADRFRVMLSSELVVVNTSEERDSQFHFHGFYKQLLDLFLVRRNIRSRVVIDPYREEIFFPDIDDRLRALNRRERAFYALMLCYGPEGIDFNPPATAARMGEYDERMGSIQQQYERIYRLFGGERESVPDLADPFIRRPMISRLRASVKNLEELLYNPDDYNLTKNPDKSFAVHLDPELISVVRLGDGAALPLRKSGLYDIVRGESMDNNRK